MGCGGGETGHVAHVGVQQSHQQNQKQGCNDPRFLTFDIFQTEEFSVVLRYFYKLRKAKTAFPRRQEANRETCELTDGSEVSAIVSREEVRGWAEGGKKAIICSVSHSWETREHPDPCRFQLEQIVNFVSLFDAAYFDDVWLFYDYVSLFQFQRESEEQNASFKAAMSDMHVLYSHKFSRTFRIENLTPEPVWRAMLENPAEQVRVYFDEAKAVTPRPLKDLVENRVPYGDRGWCKAEVEWSSTRDFTAKNQRIDAAGEEEGSELKGRVPTTPELFKAQMASAKFTHRADAGSVQVLPTRRCQFVRRRCLKTCLYQKLPSWQPPSRTTSSSEPFDCGTSNAARTRPKHLARPGCVWAAGSAPLSLTAK